MIISFDFDDTLCQEMPTGFDGHANLGMPTVEILKEYYSLGCTCIILTARVNSQGNINEITSFLKNFDIYHMVDKICFTDHDLKGYHARRLGVSLHYDDCDVQIESLRSFGITCIDSKGI